MLCAEQLHLLLPCPTQSRLVRTLGTNVQIDYLEEPAGLGCSDSLDSGLARPLEQQEVPQPFAPSPRRNLKATFDLTADARRRNPSLAVGNPRCVSSVNRRLALASLAAGGLGSDERGPPTLRYLGKDGWPNLAFLRERRMAQSRLPGFLGRRSVFGALRAEAERQGFRSAGAAVDNPPVAARGRCGWTFCRPGRRFGGEPALDAADRPAVPEDPVLRQPTDDSVLGAIRGGRSIASGSNGSWPEWAWRRSSPGRGPRSR